MSNDLPDGYDLDVSKEDDPTPAMSEPERPKIHGTAAAAPPPPVRVGRVGIADQLTTHMSRVFADDPLESTLSDEDRWFDVATPPVADDIFKRFLLTRRSALFVGFLVLTLSGIFYVVGLVVNWSDVPGAGKAAVALVVIGIGLLAFVAFQASRDWALWRRQKKNVALSVSAFGSAALLSGFIATGPPVGPLTYIMVLVPPLLALGSALTRTAIDVKLLFPRSPVGGWLVTMAAPLQSLLAVATLMLIYQSGGGALSLLVLVSLAGAPVGLLIAAGDLRRPNTPEDATELLDTPRLVLLGGYGLGALFTMILLFSEAGGSGAPFVLGVLFLVVGLYFMVRVLLLDFTVTLLSEARAVADSVELAESHASAKAEWEGFDREVTRDHERERAIYG